MGVGYAGLTKLQNMCMRACMHVRQQQQGHLTWHIPQSTGAVCCMSTLGKLVQGQLLCTCIRAVRLAAVHLLRAAVDPQVGCVIASSADEASSKPLLMSWHSAVSSCIAVQQMTARWYTR